MNESVGKIRGDRRGMGSVADPDKDWGRNGTMVLAAWVYEMDICIHLEGGPGGDPEVES